MYCPVCNVPLIIVERRKIELDFCPKCKGFWFDAGEISMMSVALGFDLKLPDLSSLPIVTNKEKKRPCPRCEKKMEKVRIDSDTNLVIDRCSHGHGIWFDAGELSATIEKYGSHKEGPENQLVNFLGEIFCVK